MKSRRLFKNEQMDHFRSYQVNLHVSDKLIKDIYEARLIAAKSRIKINIYIGNILMNTMPSLRIRMSSYQHHKKEDIGVILL